MNMLVREMSNSENTKHSGPGVVARLMGMDTLPPVTGTTIHVKECSNKSPRQYISRTAHCESIKGPRNALPSTTFKQSGDKLPLNWKQQYSRLSIKNPNSVKPFLREHPQEEQLQKFKKEFEAWQESKLWEFSSIFDQNNSSGGLKNKQILALKTFNNEKMAGFTDLRTSVNKLKFSTNQRHGFRHDSSFGKQFMPQTKDDAIKRELANKSIEPASRAKFHEKKSGPCSPSRIVILKSFSDMNDEMEGPSGRLPKVLEKGNGIEDLLEEVKKRLKLELEGKGKNDSIRRLTAAHTSSPPHEILTDSKQLTREVAKPIKENTTSDLEATLRKSEIMRSCSNRFHFDRQDFPEFVNAETRKLVTERLKNVLKDDTKLEKLMVDDVRGEEFLQTKEKSRSKSCISLSKVGIGTSFWDPKNSVNESFSKHFRHEEVKREAVVAEVMSPPNFVRSFSAPVSRSSFGKALLKDHHATKAQNFQLHEASKNDSAVVNKSKKDGFDIKGKVSNLKRTFSLKGKLFGKKVSSIQESTEDVAYDLKPNQSMPLVLRNFGVVQDNFTEVPPTPVSFLCTPMSEHHSPVSPLEVPFVEDYLSTQVSGELIMTRPESKSLTENVEGRRYGVETAAEPYDSNEMALLEDDGEAYVRDVLLLSGLYRTWPLNQVFSNLDGQIKPIPSCVFDDLEKKNCINLARSLDDDFSAVNLGNIIVDRKLLFDLVNEALPSVIDAPMNRLVSERRAHSSTQLPTGRRLLGELLHQIQIYSNPVIDLPQSVESVVACDVKLMPLCTTSRKDIVSIGREVESAIIEDLIDGLINVLLV